MPEVTRLLDRAAAGDRLAVADLLPLVDDELRSLAAVRLSQQSPRRLMLHAIRSSASRRW